MGIWVERSTGAPGQEQEVDPHGMESQETRAERVHWLSDCPTSASQDMFSNDLFEQNTSHRLSLPNETRLQGKGS